MRDVSMQPHIEAMKRIAAQRLANMVEAGAIIMANEVRAVISESEPAGRIYTIPGTKTKYQASAPGQPPAERENIYAESIKATPAQRVGNEVQAFAYTDRTVGSANQYVLGDILEHGAQLANGGVIEPRPHWRPAMKRARRKLLDLLRRGGGGSFGVGVSRP